MPLLSMDAGAACAACSVHGLAQQSIPSPSLPAARCSLPTAAAVRHVCSHVHRRRQCLRHCVTHMPVDAVSPHLRRFLPRRLRRRIVGALCAP